MADMKDENQAPEGGLAGYKLVPVEPTQEMLEAARRAPRPTKPSEISSNTPGSKPRRGIG